MRLEWVQNGKDCENAATELGTYTIRGQFYLGLMKQDGETVDPYGEGIEYLGKYDDPKQAAQDHYDANSLVPQNAASCK